MVRPAASSRARLLDERGLLFEGGRGGAQAVASGQVIGPGGKQAGVIVGGDGQASGEQPSSASRRTRAPLRGRARRRASCREWAGDRPRWQTGGRDRRRRWSGQRRAAELGFSTNEGSSSRAGAAARKLSRVGR